VLSIDASASETSASRSSENEMLSSGYRRARCQPIGVESASATKEFFLSDFFVVYDEPLMREGYELSMTVNGVPSDVFGDLRLAEPQAIVLEYTSAGESATEEDDEEYIGVEEGTDADQEDIE
jgi:hypothetical protein